MHLKAIHLGLLIFCTTAWSGNPADIFAEQSRLAASKGWVEQPIGTLITQLGRTFLGTPYVAHSLENEGHESLVVKLDGFDCLTFTESMLTMARTLQDRGSFPQYRHHLRQIRYRDGKLEDYFSRLHYTSEWATNNAQKGYLEDMSRELDGIRDARPIHFMSHHPKAYAKLNGPKTIALIAAIEKTISKKPRYYIPKDRIAKVESQIQEGDILAITTDIAGLDIAHIGLATFENGRLHMLHASSTNKQVEITEKPLDQYLAGHKRQTGIMILRPKQGQQEK